jgi:CRP/FNR family transcriptional regulator, cyclic AMP receptor protein
MVKATDAMFEKFGVTYKPKQILFTEYEPGMDFYIIHSGRVRVTKIFGEKEKTLDVFGAGDIFGEMAILEEAPRSATAIAEEETKVLRFNKENFEQLLQSNPEMALKLLKILSKRIFDAKRRLKILGLKDNDAKVVDAMLMLAEQKGANPEISMPITIDANVEDISNWCGVKTEECKKVLGSYAKQQRINIDPNGKITIQNPSEFYRYIISKRKSEINK